MLTRVPDYYGDFRCLAGACPHTCCEKWEVVIDGETAALYAKTPGPLGDRLRAALREDQDGDLCFPLNGGRCPFLDGKNLCEIHRQLGEDATSVTCREHPRFIEDYGPFREVTLSASCPAANALLLGTEETLTFLEWETPEIGDPCEDEGDEWLPFLLPLRERMLVLLGDRNRPLRRRLAEFLSMAHEAQALLDDEQLEELEGLSVEDLPTPETWAEASGLFPAGLRFLRELEILELDWRDLLVQAETAAPAAQKETLLERLAVYFAFRYLLKTVNDGDLLSRAQLCVFAVLVIERLSAVCGLPEASRRFSCEIEHSGENLDALVRGFCQEEALSWQALMEELSAR